MASLLHSVILGVAAVDEAVQQVRLWSLGRRFPAPHVKAPSRMPINISLPSQSANHPCMSVPVVHVTGNALNNLHTSRDSSDNSRSGQEALSLQGIGLCWRSGLWRSHGGVAVGRAAILLVECWWVHLHAAV